MKLHFSIGESQVACGKNNHDLVATSENDRVTCIKCRSSLIFQKSVNPEINLHFPRKVEGLLPKDFWKKYITELPGYNRLPRGLK